MKLESTTGVLLVGKGMLYGASVACATLDEEDGLFVSSSGYTLSTSTALSYSFKEPLPSSSRVSLFSSFLRFYAMFLIGFVLLTF